MVASTGLPAVTYELNVYPNPEDAELTQSVPLLVRTFPEVPGATVLKAFDAPATTTPCCVTALPVYPPAPSAVTTPVTLRFNALLIAIKHL